MDGKRFIDRVRRAAAKKILYLPHAIRQMSHPNRMITTTEVALVVTQGRIIEEYPEDARGHSALLLGTTEPGRFIHVVCSPKDEYLAIITAYVPDPEFWSPDFATRISR